MVVCSRCSLLYMWDFPFCLYLYIHSLFISPCTGHPVPKAELIHLLEYGPGLWTVKRGLSRNTCTGEWYGSWQTAGEWLVICQSAPLSGQCPFPWAVSFYGFLGVLGDHGVLLTMFLLSSQSHHTLCFYWGWNVLSWVRDRLYTWPLRSIRTLGKLHDLPVPLTYKLG